jgi:hypothetical protein
MLFIEQAGGCQPARFRRKADQLQKKKTLPTHKWIKASKTSHTKVHRLIVSV